MEGGSVGFPTRPPTLAFLLEATSDLPRRLHNLPLEERPHYIILDQPITVLGVRAVIPRRVVHAQTDKPAVEHVVAQLLAQQPLTANPVECLQQQPPQQPLR